MAMKVFQPEEMLTASDLNTYAVNALGVRKLTSTSVVNSTIVTNDNHLFVTVAANSTYELSGLLRYTAAAGSPGLKFTFSGPSGTTLAWSALALPMGSTSQSDVATIPASMATEMQVGTLAPGTQFVHFHGCLVTGVSVGGTFRLQFAQAVASSNQVTLLDDSYFVLRRFL